jgi:hypothetical protein
MSHSIKLGQITLHLFSGDTLALADILPRGVALDGCLRGPTIGSDDRWSFDHHDNCLRMITLSTCEQVRTVLCLGGQQWFHDRDVYINDLDGDTLLSLWLIINTVQRANHHRVRDLVRSVGTIDSHGPAGSLLLSPTENELAEQFYRQAIKPVTDLRGGVREVFAEWPALIEQCMAGISLLIDAPRTTVAEPPEQPPIQIVKAVGTKMLGTCDGFGFAQAYEQGWDVRCSTSPLRTARPHTPSPSAATWWRGL